MLIYSCFVTTPDFYYMPITNLVSNMHWGVLNANWIHYFKNDLGTNHVLYIHLVTR